MNKRYAFAFIITACLAGLGCKTATDPLGSELVEQATAEITEMMDASAKAWNDNDLDGFMAGFHNSPDLRFVVPSGITMGWDDLKARYARSIEKSDLRFSDMTVDLITPDTALVFAIFHNDTAEGDYSYGATSLLMEKIDGNWVIVHDHSSGLPPKEKE